jgi:hypothetical protein
VLGGSDEERVEHGLADLTVHPSPGVGGGPVGVRHVDGEAIRDRPDVGGRQQQVVTGVRLRAVHEDFPQEPGTHTERLQHGLDRDPLFSPEAARRPRGDRAVRGHPRQLTEDVDDVLPTAALQLTAVHDRGVAVERLLLHDPRRHLGRQRRHVLEQALAQTPRGRAERSGVHGVMVDPRHPARGVRLCARTATSVPMTIGRPPPGSDHRATPPLRPAAHHDRGKPEPHGGNR